MGLAARVVATIHDYHYTGSQTQTEFAMKRRELEKHLKAHGCYLHHAGSNHDIWVNPETGAKQPIPRHNELKTPLGKDVCRKLGVPIITKK